MLLTTETIFSYIQPHWPAPPNIIAYQTTRQIGLAVENCTPLWLKQVHGNQVINRGMDHSIDPEADACFSTTPQVVCAVKTADCLPILLCDRRGSVVSAIHAGWKSILAGIIEITIAALPVNAKELLAWLGPAIGPGKFEIGNDVYDFFMTYDEGSAACFRPYGTDKWLANLYQLARQRLFTCGIEKEDVYGGDYCTYSQEYFFFSYRRDGDQTGRMASLIWLVTPHCNTLTPPNTEVC